MGVDIDRGTPFEILQMANPESPRLLVTFPINFTHPIAVAPTLSIKADDGKLNRFLVQLP